MLYLEVPPLTGAVLKGASVYTNAVLCMYPCANVHSRVRMSVRMLCPSMCKDASFCMPLYLRVHVSARACACVCVCKSVDVCE